MAVHRSIAVLAGTAMALALGACAAMGSSGRGSASSAPDFAARCTALQGKTDTVFGTIDTAALGPAEFNGQQVFLPTPFALPRHCDIHGAFPSRKGGHGQTYAIKYHLRLPEDWNGRFLFQGGGGMNGVVGEAMGWIGVGMQPGIVQGYAVVSQDSGHDKTVNIDPDWAGEGVFGTDPEARRNYGNGSLPVVAGAAKALIRSFYGSNPRYSYFFGCSKGGQEGMAFAQRYPDTFDGIVAAAPGMSLPRAAVAQAWDVQTFAKLWNSDKGPLTPTSFAGLFSKSDFDLVHQAVGAACDGLDGVKDGMVEDFAQCTKDRVLSELHKRECKPGSPGECLAEDKITALDRSLEGPRDVQGKPIYATWPWDMGIGTFGWSLWKLGSPQMPSLNILTGGASLPTVFMTPPRAVKEDPQSLLNFQMAFKFPQDAAAIYATTPEFPRSSWQDIGMRSPDLDGFRKHGGKLIVPHGVSDPVFSVNDTIAWRGEVNARYHGDADSTVRVFPVPGMNHCFGGPATDEYNAFGALVNWVEKGQAPQFILAKAGPDAPWPGRTRPLCPYPQVARYRGTGSIEDAKNFECVAP
jgi:feruloyl esterase